jgi:hypothetical protein
MLFGSGRKAVGLSEVDDYRANLAVCWRMSNKSFDAERRAWLDMGESWKLLIISSEALPFEENIDARVTPRPTMARIWQWLHKHSLRGERLASFNWFL